jgi:16S rRNA (cytosine967-C5)-methyltransferase
VPAITERAGADRGTPVSRGRRRPEVATDVVKPRNSDPARRTAFDLLRTVRERDAYANLALPRLITERGLSVRDAAFATELGYGALRSCGTYDAVIDACIDRAGDRVDPGVRDVLRLGAHQLLAMRTPPHAAVSASVDLCRATIGQSPAGFVNAVLRKVGAADLDGWTDRLAAASAPDPAARLAFRHGHPEWVVRAFADALGGDWNDTALALAADNLAPRVTLAARPGRCTQAELVAAGLTATTWSPHGAVLSAGAPGNLAVVRSGAAGVQDEGSQLVAAALAAAPLTGRDELWLDACAGPGGKAALLHGLATQRGAHLLAAELAPHRARLIAGALAGAGPAWVVTADATAPPWPDATFDRVLLDVPCSGLGALRRRPESRWRRQPADVGRLFDLQRVLLERALDAARPGGLVGYVTCSPHRVETVGVVHAVRESAARRGRRTELLDACALLPELPNPGPAPFVQLWPHRHGTDAMFLALLRRES